MLPVKVVTGAGRELVVNFVIWGKLTYLGLGFLLCEREGLFRPFLLKPGPGTRSIAPPGADGKCRLSGPIPGQVRLNLHLKISR